MMGGAQILVDFLGRLKVLLKFCHKPPPPPWRLLMESPKLMDLTPANSLQATNMLEVTRIRVWFKPQQIVAFAL